LQGGGAPNQAGACLADTSDRRSRRSRASVIVGETLRTPACSRRTVRRSLRYGSTMVAGRREALVDLTLQMRIMVLLQLSRMPALDDGNAIDRNVMELMNDMRANAVPLEHLAVLSGTRASRECARSGVRYTHQICTPHTLWTRACGRRPRSDPLRKKLALHTLE